MSHPESEEQSDDTLRLQGEMDTQQADITIQPLADELPPTPPRRRPRWILGQMRRLL